MRDRSVFDQNNMRNVGLGILIPLSLSSVRPDQTSQLTKFIPLNVNIGDGAQSSPLQVQIPTKGELSIRSPEELYRHVISSWEAVVKSHSAGLTEPKNAGSLPAGLSPEEAWHHFTAGQEGVVDSARFLITFSLVPSVQTGGSPLHIAASLGQLDTVRRLLDSGARVDEVKEDGNTALHCAAIMGHLSVVELLLEEEADTEATGT